MTKANPIIYLIDDDHIYHSITEMLLERVTPRHQLMTFYNGSEAIQQLRNDLNDALKLPKIILLDINMPISDGWNFLDELKPIYDLLAIKPKISMMSSSSLERDIERAMSYNNVVGFITKPVTIDHLQNIINQG